jgi:hypothetical protein
LSDLSLTVHPSPTRVTVAKTVPSISKAMRSWSILSAIGCMAALGIAGWAVAGGRRAAGVGWEIVRLCVPVRAAVLILSCTAAMTSSVLLPTLEAE